MNRAERRKRGITKRRVERELTWIRRPGSHRLQREFRLDDRRLRIWAKAEENDWAINRDEIDLDVIRSLMGDSRADERLKAVLDFCG